MRGKRERRKDSKPPRNHRKVISDMLRALKIATPCVDCGQHYHFSAMHFDHIAPKAFNLSLAHTKSMKAVIAEIHKCEIVCANCHAVRTYKHQRQVKLITGGRRFRSSDFTSSLEALVN